MKTPTLNTKSNNKSILFLLSLLSLHTSSFSQSKLPSLMSTFNIEWVFAVICVSGLGLFLIVAYMKQKNH